MADKLTDEQYQAIQEKHPGVRLRRVMCAAGELVLRAPTAVEESTFQSMMFGSAMHAGMAWRNLLVMIAVHPDKTTLQTWLTEWPAIPINQRVIAALKLIRGETDEEEGK